MNKKNQPLDFTNTQGYEMTNMLDYPNAEYCERTPETDSHTVNFDTSVNMSLDHYKSVVCSKDGRNVWWTTDLDVELPIKMGSNGLSKNVIPQTVCAVFKKGAYLRNN